MDSSKKQLQEMVVTSNYMITSDCFVVECFNPTQQIPKIVPGQFAQLKIDDNPAVFLRRPFSIHDYDEKKNTISFMIKIVGNGSKSLSALNVDTAINVMFPLGNGFTVEAAAGKKSLLVGGGVGIAPIYLLAKTLRQQNCDFDVILGGKSAEDLLRYDDFVAFSKVYCTTEDGSKGCKGFVTNHRQLAADVKSYDNIYCCGPTPMMKAIAAVAQNNGVNCEVSLENKMACGFGVCLCCVTPTTSGNECVCAKGPVFNANDLKW